MRPELGHFAQKFVQMGSLLLMPNHILHSYQMFTSSQSCQDKTLLFSELISMKTFLIFLEFLKNSVLAGHFSPKTEFLKNSKKIQNVFIEISSENNNVLSQHDCELVNVWYEYKIWFSVSSKIPTWTNFWAKWPSSGRILKQF